MKIGQDITLTVLSLTDYVDEDGFVCLKAKAYNGYRCQTTKNGLRTRYNNFTSVRLYPVNLEQLEETKNRLFSQKTDKPKLKIIAYESELFTGLFAGQIRPILYVKKYDFFAERMFRRKQLLNYGKEN